MKAKVKWFNDAKGYGFIENNEMEDVFVHYSQIKKDGYKSLATGDMVQFDLITTDKGYQAQNVALINDNVPVI